MRRPRALLTIAALTLIVAGCGSGAEDGTAPPALRDPGPGADELLAPAPKTRAPGAGRRARRPPATGPVRKRAAAKPRAERRARRRAAPSLPAGARPVGGLTPGGRSDVAAVRATLTRYVALVRRGDPSFCTELVTRRFVEAVSRRRGAAAVAACREAARTPTPIALETIEGVRVEGDAALVQFVSAVRGERRRQVLRLARVGGRWLIDGDGSRGL